MNLDVEAHASSGLPAFYYILVDLQRKILAQAFAYVVSGMYGDPLGSLSGEVSPRGLKVSNRNTWASLQYLFRSIGIRSTVLLLETITLCRLGQALIWSDTLSAIILALFRENSNMMFFFEMRLLKVVLDLFPFKNIFHRCPRRALGMGMSCVIIAPLRSRSIFKSDPRYVDMCWK